MVEVDKNVRLGKGKRTTPRKNKYNQKYLKHTNVTSVVRFENPDF